MCDPGEECHCVTFHSLVAACCTPACCQSELHMLKTHRRSNTVSTGMRSTNDQHTMQTPTGPRWPVVISIALLQCLRVWLRRSNLYEEASPEGAENAQLFRLTELSKTNFTGVLRALALRANGVTPVEPNPDFVQDLKAAVGAHSHRRLV